MTTASNGDRWLGLYRLGMICTSTLTLSLFAIIGTGLLLGQTMMREQIAEQTRLLAQMIERVDQNRTNIGILQNGANGTNDRVNQIDGRVNRLEGLGQR